ncbi:hypothetical protein [Maribellus maritimus]|uniref:hypothetical protein n=1 Tax=Maribellus maritimus TaxID=2870838 RepID=UPI001EEBA1AE|nr:hypothetical protein [Maribellus maritimus]MCG6187624.1 hypothetical protein [Maribellus maritimus]
MDPQKRLGLKTSIEKGNFSYQFIFIEIVLSQPNILRSLSKQDLTQLLGAAISVFQDKNNPEINYSLLSLSSTGLVLGRILEKNQNVEFSDIKNRFLQCEDFIKEGITDNRKMLICINNMADLYYKKLLP